MRQRIPVQGESIFRKSFGWVFYLVGFCLFLAGCSSDKPDVLNDSKSEETGLYFREDWKQIPAHVPVTQEHVQNPNLLLSRHGPGGNLIKKSHHDDIPGDPWYVWSGLCDELWMLTLQKENALVDLSKGRIRLRARQSGDNILKLVLGLENGIWLVSETGFSKTPDWHEFSVNTVDLKWHYLDVITLEAGDFVNAPDLRRVRSIGWTDLTTGAESDACTRADWIEVYGKEIPLHKNT